MIQLSPARRTGYSLERSYYVDPKVFEIDLEHIFRRHWLLAGPECQHHHWSYQLDGSLSAARHLPANVDRSTLGLHPVQVQVVEGLIFVCLAKSPPDFSQTASDVTAFLRPHGLPHTKICHRSQEIIQANWKVVAENFWECYHCAGTHPEFCNVMSYAHSQNSERLARGQKEFELD
jgi:phenylpropionate dioxygenase-like ring-hydroxylating dioxygenase large terminal subunit